LIISTLNVAWVIPQACSYSCNFRTALPTADEGKRVIYSHLLSFPLFFAVEHGKSVDTVTYYFSGDEVAALFPVSFLFCIVGIEENASALLRGEF
jgi:hypothetical protein